MEQAVRFESVTKTFGDVVANDEISFDVEEGSLHAVLGENGAGKTTLMNVLYGLYEPDSGSVTVQGSRREFDSPRDAIDAGVGMIHQHFKLVETMSVAKNVVLGYEPREFFSMFSDEEAANQAVRSLSDAYGFDVDPTATISSVGVGVQQRVEILKALYRGADILVLDEPTAVLTPQEVDHLFDVFDDLLADGKTIIFITHKIGEALDVADDITVLRDGNHIDTVDAQATDREQLAQLMVGREIDFSVDQEPHVYGEAILSVSGLANQTGNTSTTIEDLNFDIKRGEVFGIVGVDGNGQETLIESLVGIDIPDDGHIEYRGEAITHERRRNRHLPGLSYIPSDRQGEGLVMDFTLRENAILGEQGTERFADNGWIAWDRAQDYTRKIIEEYGVEPSDPAARAKSLSGGNQQKFLVGRELLSDPELIIASNPTRGVDIGSVEFIHERLLEMRNRDKAVLLVSSKLDEVRKLADRVAVMYEGSFMDVVDPETTTEREFGLLMAGQGSEMADETEASAEVS